jgi:hypothetical protein
VTLYKDSKEFSPQRSFFGIDFFQQDDLRLGYMDRELSIGVLPQLLLGHFVL